MGMQRFFMMKKSKSNKSALVKYLLMVPILIFLLILCSQQDIYSQTISTHVEQKVDKVHKVVEEMPRFPGCESIEDSHEKKQCATKNLFAFILQNLKYPKKAKAAKIQGTVMLSFIIDKSGNIQDAKIINEIGGGCGKEALRVVNTMPQWIPGKLGGKAVSVQFNLPVKFKA